VARTGYHTDVVDWYAEIFAEIVSNDQQLVSNDSLDCLENFFACEIGRGDFFERRFQECGRDGENNNIGGRKRCLQVVRYFDLC
jgi:hypothetical protein